MIPSHDALPDDPAALKAIILSQRAEALRMAASVRAYEALIQALKIRIAKLKKQKFGPSSEKIEREIDQLQLALEDLEVAMATAEAVSAPMEAAAITKAPADRFEPRRRGKPRIAATTPRERVVLDPGERCPDCGGALRLVGEDVAEILELVTAQLKVIETARLKKSCRQCEKMVQTAAPTRPIPRGMAGPALLAHILVAKYDDHVPLYRQGEIFARQGADIPRSTLIDWCGEAIAVLRPLVERIKAEVMRTDRLHADDTPIQVLDPKVRQSRGKARAVKEGRIWTYVRDDRPWGGNDPPAVADFFSPDRKGEHPQGHLADFKGILQADAGACPRAGLQPVPWGGFAKLYEAAPGIGPRIREAACWAHLRRDFHDVWKATGSPIAKDALERIGKLYDIERQITGQPAERRREVRQERSRPHVQAFRTWCENQLARVRPRATSPRPCAMRSIAGRGSRCSSMTAAWRSGGRTGFSPARTPAARLSPTR
jgi:Transposase and inactivated derivatives